MILNREPEQDASTAGTATSASQAGLAGIESIESAFGSRAMNLRDMMRRDGWMGSIVKLSDMRSVTRLSFEFHLKHVQFKEEQGTNG